MLLWALTCLMASLAAAQTDDQPVEADSVKDSGILLQMDGNTAPSVYRCKSSYKTRSDTLWLKTVFTVTRADWVSQAWRDTSLYLCCRMTGKGHTGTTEVVGQVKGQHWDPENSKGSLCISTFAPGCGLTVTYSLSSGPESACWIPLVIISVEAPLSPSCRIGQWKWK